MIDWTKPLCTKHDTPRIGRRLPDCPKHGKKRLVIYSETVSGWSGQTTFRYDDEGNARQGAGPSDNDLVNFDPEDGAVRISDSGRKTTCERAA